MSWKNSITVRRETCPVCRTSGGQTLLNIPYEDSRVREYLTQVYQGNVDAALLSGVCLEYIQCSTCMLIYQANVLNEDGLKLLYDRWIDPGLAEKWCGDGVERARLSYAQRLIYMRRKSGVSKPRLLDYGAGFGIFCEMAVERGFDVTALEFSSDRRARLEKKDIKTVDNTDGLTGLYDFINVDQVLEHLMDPRAVLQSLCSLLRPGGCIYLSVPCAAGLRKYLLSVSHGKGSLYVDRLAGASALQHINSFSRSVLVTLADSCGLQLIFSPFGELACRCRSVRDMVRPFYHYMTTSLYFLKAS